MISIHLIIFNLIWNKLSAGTSPFSFSSRSLHLACSDRLRTSCRPQEPCPSAVLDVSRVYFPLFFCSINGFSLLINRLFSVGFSRTCWLRNNKEAALLFELMNVWREYFLWFFFLPAINKWPALPGHQSAGHTLDENGLNKFTTFSASVAGKSAESLHQVALVFTLAILGSSFVTIDGQFNAICDLVSWKIN